MRTFSDIKFIKVMVVFNDGKEYGFNIPVQKGYEERTLRNFSNGSKFAFNRIADKICHLATLNNNKTGETMW
jgi:hypothetical protein